jgi:hypothetical protein
MNPYFSLSLATSDGREQSLTNNKSKNCTLVFRIHFGKKEVQSPSCPLFDRKNGNTMCSLKLNHRKFNDNCFAGL